MSAKSETNCSRSAPTRMIIRVVACAYVLAAAFGLIPLANGPLATVAFAILAIPLLSVRWHHLSALALMALIILTAADAPLGIGPLGGLEQVAAALAVLLILIMSHLNAPGAIRFRPSAREA